MTADLREQLQESLGETYTVERELGGGGMSRVFLAMERALHRPVVIKLLPPELAAGVSIDRFRREIMLAARLQHPHIVPLLSAGESGGLPYLTMPYVEGESLRTLLARGGELPVADGLRILREVASALGYAHEQGIVHRDVKPDNVLLSHGSAMVTDFGVAKALSESSNTQGDGLTAHGVALGTPAYMSPEQAAASPNIDARADIYAFGVMAYELFAGQPPFAGRAFQALLAAHATEAPEPVQKRRPSLPPALAVLIMRCLEKNPADRPQRASEIVHALDALTTPATGTAPTTATRGEPSAKRRPSRGAAVAAALIMAALVGVWLARRPASPSLHGKTSIAVLPFAAGGDTASAYLSDGLTDGIINLLAAIPSVSVPPRSSVMQYKGKDISDHAAIAHRLGVTHLIEGNVRRTPTTIKVSAELVDVQANAVLASRSVERPASDVFTVEDDVAREIVRALSTKLGISVGAASLHRGTDNQQAYELFLKGKYFADRFTEEDFRRAIDLYRQSIALDSSFARPWAGIASAWTNLADSWLPPSDTYPQAETAAHKALALDPSLAEAHANLGDVLLFYRRDYPAAYGELRTSFALDSNSVDAPVGLASFFAAFGMRDSSRRYVRRTIAIDSLSVTNLNNVSWIHGLNGDDGEALSALHQAEALAGASMPEVPELLLSLGRRAEADSASRVACKSSAVCIETPRALILRGDIAGARRALTVMIQRSKDGRRYVSPLDIASLEVATGDTAAALQWLERGFSERTAPIVMLMRSPAFRPLHGNSQFKDLVHRAGLDVPFVFPKD